MHSLNMALIHSRVKNLTNNTAMVSTLSKREYEIAELIAWGLIKKEIASRLNISYHTVDQHIRNIYKKLQIRKETDLTRWYFIHRYDIPAENPLRKIMAVFLLLITLGSIVTDQNMLRVFRTRTITTARIRKTKSRRDQIYYLEAS